MLVVIALGGNALLRRGEPLDAATQRVNAKVAAESVAEVARDHDVVLTHGNGPQVGLLALQNAAYPDVTPYPLDVLGAETEGMVGYLLEQELSDHVVQDRIAVLLTQVVVNASDPAFGHPTKFVGPVYDEASAKRLAAERGWTVAPDGPRWRRVVPSPEPGRIVELRTIRLLVQHRVLVICAGGGGIPVVEDANGLRGVEAVVDKDLVAALLAAQLGADALLLLTDVDAVYEGWGTPAASAIRRATPEQLRSLGAAAGSMGPKVEAAARFVEQRGGVAGIGALDDAAAILRGEAGTSVTGAIEGPMALWPERERAHDQDDLHVEVSDHDRNR
ncbi:MAG TPA: carbamate kinase [Acidimicrobiales bacterium]